MAISYNFFVVMKIVMRMKWRHRFVGMFSRVYAGDREKGKADRYSSGGGTRCRKSDGCSVLSSVERDLRTKLTIAGLASTAN